MKEAASKVRSLSGPEPKLMRCAYEQFQAVEDVVDVEEQVVAAAQATWEPDNTAGVSRMDDGKEVSVSLVEAMVASVVTPVAPAESRVFPIKQRGPTEEERATQVETLVCGLQVQSTSLDTITVRVEPKSPVEFISGTADTLELQANDQVPPVGIAELTTHTVVGKTPLTLVEDHVTSSKTVDVTSVTEKRVFILEVVDPVEIPACAKQAKIPPSLEISYPHLETAAVPVDDQITPVSCDNSDEIDRRIIISPDIREDHITPLVPPESNTCAVEKVHQIKTHLPVLEQHREIQTNSFETNVHVKVAVVAQVESSDPTSRLKTVSQDNAISTFWPICDPTQDSAYPSNIHFAPRRNSQTPTGAKNKD